MSACLFPIGEITGGSPGSALGVVPLALGDPRSDTPPPRASAPCKLSLRFFQDGYCIQFHVLSLLFPQLLF